MLPRFSLPLCSLTQRKQEKSKAATCGALCGVLVTLTGWHADQSCIKNQLRLCFFCTPHHSILIIYRLKAEEPPLYCANVWLSFSINDISLDKKCFREAGLDVYMYTYPVCLQPDANAIEKCGFLCWLREAKFLECNVCLRFFGEPSSSAVSGWVMNSRLHWRWHHQHQG